MKPLSQHIQETLYDESLKEVFVEKLVEEDLSDLMRTGTQDGEIMKGTLRDTEDYKNKSI